MRDKMGEDNAAVGCGGTNVTDGLDVSTGQLPGFQANRLVKTLPFEMCFCRGSMHNGRGQAAEGNLCLLDIVMGRDRNHHSNVDDSDGLSLPETKLEKNSTLIPCHRGKPNLSQ